MFKTKKIVIIVGIVTLVIVGTIVAALVIHKDELPIVQNSTTLIVVSERGGLCANNARCNSSSYVYKNGRYNDKQISDTDLNAIKDLVDSIDESKYSREDCGASTFDGSDTVLAFPGRFSDRSFEECQMPGRVGDPNINQVKEIEAILAKYS